MHSLGDLKKDSSGRPYQQFGTTQDITDRKRGEEALRRSQFYLSEGQRLAHMGSWAAKDLGIRWTGRKGTTRRRVSPRLHFPAPYIYPVEPRKEPNLSYRLMRAIYPVLRMLFPNQVIRADDLGRAMVDVAVQERGGSQSPILENRDIRAMVESLRLKQVGG